MSTKYDLDFYWDPICPFAWMTSRWIVQVQEEYAKEGNSLNVDWKFICLLEINKEKDYSKFAPGYKEAHTSGRNMLRVAAAARKEFGRETMGALYTAYGESIWDQAPPANLDPANSGSKGNSLDNLALAMSSYSNKERIESALEKAGLPITLSAAAKDAQYDEELANETAEAFSRTGKGVGTPIITYNPPEGQSFFGPVISALPKTGKEAVKYFEAVVTLLGWKSFAEIKRNRRDELELKVLGN